MIMKRKKIISMWFVLLFLSFFSSCSDEETNTTLDTGGNYVSISTKVSMEEAKTELEAILNDVDAPTTRFASNVKRRIANSFTVRGESVQTRISSETPTVHVFNFEEKKGFAIMSGDRRVPSLIALADSGEISEEEAIENPGVAVFLEKMEERYDDDISSSSSISSGNIKYGAWQNIVYKDCGYCNVKWGQNPPYNKYCPLENEERTVTGCVATAVAQLMSIYKYPSSYNGYSFDWDKMTEYYSVSSCSSTAQDQIARLMEQLGKEKNLNTSYHTVSNGGSGANAENIARTLKNFGYSNGGTLGEYNTDKVVSELKNGYSVLVGGFCHKKTTRILGFKVKTSYTGGHRWLCHGLLERRRTIKVYNSNGELTKTYTESTWYPLCNWGWDGSFDGYYLSGAFDSTTGGIYPDNATSTRAENENNSKDYDYQYNITAVTGIRK